MLARVKSVVLVAVVLLLALSSLSGIPTLTAQAARVDPSKITETVIDESKVSETYYVDANHKNKSDSNSGTEKEPFATIGQAVRAATQNRKDGKGTKVKIKPGIYRETVRLATVMANPEAPIIFEGTDRDEVFLRGSIILAGAWVKEGDYYTHDWTMAWSASRDIYADEFDLSIPEIVRRKEVIYVNGVRKTQVMTKEELAPGKLFVDNGEKKAYFMPSDDSEIMADSVEVSIHESVFSFYETGDILIRNMTIDQANPYHTGSAMSFYKTQNIVMQDCDIKDNNWMGLGIFETKNITIDRIRINSNGGGGINASGNDNVLIRDCETSYNNWRGLLGGFCDWDTGGVKFLFTYDIQILRHKAIDNNASGIWFDSECRNVIVDQCVVTGSESPGDDISAGFYIEGNIGPILITDCVSRDNKRGFNLSSSNDVMIRNTQIANNRLSQIYIFGNWGQGRTFKERNSENNVTSFPHDNILEDVVISAGAGNQDPLITYDYGDKSGYVVWLNSSTWTRVNVYHPTPETAFLMMDSATRSGQSEWTQACGKEVTWAPAPPLNLQMQDKKGKISLSWEKSLDEVDGYIVYCDGKELTRTDSLSYQADKKSDFGRYDVAAYKGEVLSARSNIAWFTDGEEEGLIGGNKQGENKVSDQTILIILLAVAALLVMAIFAAVIVMMLKSKKRK